MTTCSLDLEHAVGEPKTLFHASECSWVEPHHDENYVTDGPFLLRGPKQGLFMLWSSFRGGRYAQAISHSPSGVLGPWTHHGEPLYESDGGHGMIFRDFDGRLLLALHSPNRSPDERAHFIEVEFGGEGLQVRG